MKKKVILIIFALLIYLYISLSGIQIEAYINWSIYLPKEKNIDTIYTYDYREGEDLLILTYNKANLKKVINKNKLILINCK